MRARSQCRPRLHAFRFRTRADGVELATSPAPNRALIDSLGLEAAVMLARSDGAALAGIGRLA
jgi:hypothetical protein